MNEYEIESWLKNQLPQFAESNLNTSKWEIYFDDLVELFKKFGDAYYEKIKNKGGVR